MANYTILYHSIPGWLNGRVGHVRTQVPGGFLGSGRGELTLGIWWHFLCNAACLARPHLFYAPFIASRIAMICQCTSHV